MENVKRTIMNEFWAGILIVFCFCFPFCSMFLNKLAFYIAIICRLYNMNVDIFKRHQRHIHSHTHTLHFMLASKKSANILRFSWKCDAPYSLALPQNSLLKWVNSMNFNLLYTLFIHKHTHITKSTWIFIP